MDYWSAFAIVISVYALLEYAYLTYMSPTYTRSFRDITGDSSLTLTFNGHALLAYACIVLAIHGLIGDPIWKSQASGVTRGAVVGAAIYGVYNMTLKAIVGSRYDSGLMWTDMTWGIAIMSIVSMLFANLKS